MHVLQVVPIRVPLRFSTNAFGGPHMARKHFAALIATAGLAFAATQANATVFAGEWELTTYNSSDPGLVLNTYTIGSNNFSVDLAAQDPDYESLFYIYTNETHINPDDTASSLISLKFTFTSPEGNDGPLVIGGTTQGYAEFFGIFQGGTLTWQNGGQALLTWGYNDPNLIDPGRMTLTVNGGSFNEGFLGLNEGKKHGLKVKAKFDWDNDPTFGAVPEPSAWALMIGGFGMAGAMIRRRRALALG